MEEFATGIGDWVRITQIPLQYREVHEIVITGHFRDYRLGMTDFGVPIVNQSAMN